jgi:phosphoglycolate phosphatase-like HAD superfamily hydrolase
MEIKAIIFDLDGTIIDSSKAILLSLFDAVKKCGAKTNFKDFDFNKIRGHNLYDTVRILLPDADSDLLKKVADNYVIHYLNNHQGSVASFPKVKETIENLYSKGIKICLFTAKTTKSAKKELEAIGVDDKFFHIQGTDPGILPKPNPDILYKLSDKMGIKSENILMVGDTNKDVCFGKNGGARTCAVTYSHYTKEDFLNQNIKPDIFLDCISKILNYV